MSTRTELAPTTGWGALLCAAHHLDGAREIRPEWKGEHSGRLCVPALLRSVVLPDLGPGEAVSDIGESTRPYWAALQLFTEAVGADPCRWEQGRPVDQVVQWLKRAAGVNGNG